MSVKRKKLSARYQGKFNWYGQTYTIYRHAHSDYQGFLSLVKALRVKLDFSHSLNFIIRRYLEYGASFSVRKRYRYDIAGEVKEWEEAKHLMLSDIDFQETSDNTYLDAYCEDFRLWVKAQVAPYEVNAEKLTEENVLDLFDLYVAEDYVSHRERRPEKEVSSTKLYSLFEEKFIPSKRYV